MPLQKDIDTTQCHNQANLCLAIIIINSQIHTDFMISQLQNIKYGTQEILVFCCALVLKDVLCLVMHECG